MKTTSNAAATNAPLNVEANGSHGYMQATTNHGSCCERCGEELPTLHIVGTPTELEFLADWKPELCSLECLAELVDFAEEADREAADAAYDREMDNRVDQARDDAW